MRIPLGRGPERVAQRRGAVPALGAAPGGRVRAHPLPRAPLLPARLLLAPAAHADHTGCAAVYALPGLQDM